MDYWLVTAALDLDGTGALETPGRWHPRGYRVVYAAETPAGALLEARVHVRAHPRRPPRNFELVQLRVGRRRYETVDARRLRPGWHRRLQETRAIGREWLEHGTASVLRVPSALIEATWNVIINVDHAGCPRLRVVSSRPHRFDARLFHALARPGAPCPQ